MWSSRNPYSFSYTPSGLIHPPRELPPPSGQFQGEQLPLRLRKSCHQLFRPTLYSHISLFRYTALRYYSVPYNPFGPPRPQRMCEP